ncbi:MAG TPA: hypothetical protein VFR01_01205, partial [Geobacterales bacterium]|nr:hypothetical protein [Geobacterales bacterium]
MASPKDKLLESAQKAILKGQIDKAIKDYEQLVALEPKDLKHRQKLGELLARANRNSDAIRQFETIARSYENDSFYLKAIAVYKQIQKLDPANLNITLTLAALNEKQGLSGNALAEYKLVVDQYERTGKAKEAAGVLEKMLAIDKENLNVQLKLAETYVTASMKDEAYTQFTAALKTIKTRGDNATFERIATKVQALFPDRDLLFESLALDAQTGSPAEIIPRLRSFLAKQPAHKRGLTLLAELQKKSGDAAGRLATLRQLLQRHPGDMETTCGFIDAAIEAGEIATAREALQHHFNILTKEPTVVEELFGKLRKAAPYDTSILQLMREFYDLTNDRAKLDEVENLLRLATPEVKSPATAQSAPEVDFSVSSGDMELDISGIGSADELFSTPATLSA